MGLRQFSSDRSSGQKQPFFSHSNAEQKREVGTTLLSVYACFALTFSKSLFVFFYIYIVSAWTFYRGMSIPSGFNTIPRATQKLCLFYYTRLMKCSQGGGGDCIRTVRVRLAGILLDSKKLPAVAAKGAAGLGCFLHRRCQATSEMQTS